MLMGYLIVVKEGLFKKKKYIFRSDIDSMRKKDVFMDELVENYMRNGKHAKIFEYTVFPDMKILRSRFDT